MILVFFFFILDVYFDIQYNIFQNLSVVFIIVGNLYGMRHVQMHQKLKHDKDQSKHIKQ